MKKDSSYHRFALALARAVKALSAQPNRQVARTWKTSPDRLQHLAKMEPGEIRKDCRVKSLVNFGAFVELAPGVDGFLHLADMTWDRSADYAASLQIGQTIEVMILEVDLQRGEVLVGYKQVELAAEEKLQKAIEVEYPVGKPVAGVVVEVVEGGLIVNIGVQAFVPASQIDIIPPCNLQQYVGNSYKFKIVKNN